VLKQKLVGIEQGPANVLEPAHPVASGRDVLGGGGHFGSQPGEFFQRIGRFTHSRNNDQEFLGTEVLQDDASLVGLALTEPLPKNNKDLIREDR
jgi:hypothetical protein